MDRIASRMGAPWVLIYRYNGFISLRCAPRTPRGPRVSERLAVADQPDGLVVKFPLAMREPRVRFPADATSFATRSGGTFSYPELKARLPVALCNLPLAYFKRVQRHCFRFMDGYRKGLIGAELDYVVKKFRGHRDIPSTHLELVKAQFAKKR